MQINQSKIIDSEQQTEEFLLYLPVQQKLTDILYKYKILQTQYEIAQNKIEYLEYKNKYLEESLINFTVQYRAQRTDRNLSHIKDIQYLEELIQNERKQLETTQKMVISHIEVGNQDESVENTKKSHSSQDSDKNNKKIGQKKSIKNDFIQKKSKIVLQKPAECEFNQKSDRRIFEVDESSNQFLIFDKNVKHDTSPNNNHFNTEVIYSYKTQRKADNIYEEKNNILKQKLVNSLKSSKKNQQETIKVKYKSNSFEQIEANIKYAKFIENFEKNSKKRIQNHENNLKSQLFIDENKVVDESSYLFMKLRGKMRWQ